MAHGRESSSDVTLEMFHGHNGLTTPEVVSLQQKWGYNEIKDRSKKWPQILWEQVYGEHWYPNSIPGMMWTAIIASLAIQDFADAGVIIGLHTFNSLLSFYETMKAGDAVAALRSALAPTCNVKRDGEWKKIMARELVPGDMVLLKIGDVVPADGMLLEGGTCDLDQSGLTGESLPVKKSPGDTVYSGTVVKRGEQDFVVTGTGENTEMGKGVALIQSVESKGQVEIIMNRITLFLLIFAVVINLLLVIVEVTNTDSLNLCNASNTGRGCYKNESRRVLQNFIVLMVAAIPIATPVVVTATMALGARKMAQQNAVVTRLSAIEELAGMTVLCSDKTGTLTKNVLTIDDPKMIDGKDGDDMIFKAALAAKTVEPDAIDKCVINALKNRSDLDKYQQIDFLPFDPVVKRTEATLKGPDGRTFKVSKGAPQVIVNMAWNRDEIKPIVDQAVVDFAGRGARPLGVAETDAQGRWVFLGLISLFDPPRDDTKIVIESAIALGSSVKMITGDHLLIAKETCRRLGMGDSILRVDALSQPHQRLLELVENVDGFAEVFPENKFEIVALFQELGHITGMTGDGVNDAPALRKANVGFAVEGATPAAQGAASVILLTPGLSVIIIAIKRSRKIFQRLQNYLIYRVFMSVFLLFFFFIAIAWVDLDFPSILIIFMCLILDLATMSLAYDKVIPSARPNRWNLTRLIVVATVIGLVAAGANLLFLGFLHNNNASMSQLQVGMKASCPVGQSHEGSAGCVPNYYTVCGQYLNAFKAATFNINNNCGNLTPESYIDTQAMRDMTAMYQQTYPLCAFRTAPNGTVNTFAQCFGIYNSRYRNTWPFTQDRVPAEFNYAERPWIPQNFPYASSIVNTILFLVLCLTCNFSVFVCRIEQIFCLRRPGFVLIGIISSEMFISSLVAAFIRNYEFWNPDVNEKTLRLTGLDGRYVVTGWLFACFTFMIMEAAKLSCFHILNLSHYKQAEAEARRRKMEETRRRLTMSKRSGTMDRNAAAAMGHGHGSSGGHGGHGGGHIASSGTNSAVTRRQTTDKKKGDGLHQPLLPAGDSDI